MPTLAQKRRSTLAAMGLAALLFTLIASAAPPAGWQAHVSSELVAVYKSSATSHPAAAPHSTGPVATASALGPRFDLAGRVQVDVLVDCAINAPTAALVAAGLHGPVSIHVPPFCVVEGWVAPAALPALTSVPGVTRVKTPAYGVRSPPKSGSSPGLTPSMKKQAAAVTSGLLTQGAGQPAVNGNAVAIMHADLFISQTGVNGAGVTVGVISNNVTSLALIQSRAELPAVQVVASTASGTPSTAPGDEGTMMLEEVHAVAPGASLAFCGPNNATSAEYRGVDGF